MTDKGLMDAAKQWLGDKGTGYCVDVVVRDWLREQEVTIFERVRKFFDKQEGKSLIEIKDIRKQLIECIDACTESILWGKK